MSISPCAANLERTRDFYAEIIGLTVGPRPPFDFQGYWLYLNDQSVVHLVLEAERRDGRPPRAADEAAETGALDHIAFRGRDLEASRALFREKGIAFRERQVPGKKLHQILRDPDGVLIELNFRGDMQN